VAKVSVVVPVYNVEKYLQECIDSIINQTLKDIEIVCVNDGSTDRSLAILNEYAKKDSRVKIISKNNSGYGHTMNVGMANATGKYVAIVESDDYISSNMLETLYEVAEKNSLDFVKSDYFTFITEDGREKTTYKSLTANKHYYGHVIDPKEDISVFNLDMLTCTGLYNRNFLLENNIRYNETPGAAHQDNGFWHQTFYFANRIYFLQKAFYHYRQDNMNSSINNRGKIFAGAKEYEYIYDILTKNQEIKDKFIYMYTYRRFNNFWYNYNRIAPEYREEFLLEFQKTFLEAEEKDELDYSLFLPWQRKTLQNIMADPILFYKKDNPIPIVFSSNNNYMPYLGVAIRSLLSKISAEKYYKIYVLHIHLTDENQEKLVLSVRNYKNVELECVNVSKQIENLKLYSRNYFSEEMYYRILIPDLFVKYEKVIYLDCDLVVQTDIAKILDYDLGNNVIGAVKNFSGKSMIKYEEETLKINSENYFNSGVLVFNNEKFKEEKIKDKCFEILAERLDLKYPDQDILNLVCLNKVFYLDREWNYTWHQFHVTNDADKLQPDEWSKYIEVQKNPYIVHFTSGIKPWSRPDKSFSYLFWEHARQSDFYEEIIYKHLKIQIDSAVINTINEQGKKTVSTISVDNNTKKPNKLSPIKRKIKGGIKCYREHGFFYTLKRVLFHLKSK